MKHVLLITFLLVTLCLSISAEWIPSNPPEIRGVTIGTPFPKVQQLLGNPKKRIDKLPESAFDKISLLYDGLEIGMDSELNVRRMIVTGKYKVFPGIEIGMNKSTVIKLLGNPNDKTNENIDFYNLKSCLKIESGLWLTFKKDKLIEIRLESNPY